MGRTACTEPQCLYKGALYLTTCVSVRVKRNASPKINKVNFLGNAKCMLKNNLLPTKSPKKKNFLTYTFNFHYYKLYSRLSVDGLSRHDRKFLMTNDECGKWRDLVSSVRTKCSVQTKITDYLRKAIIVSCVCIMHTVNKLRVLFFVCGSTKYMFRIIRVSSLSVHHPLPPG